MSGVIDEHDRAIIDATAAGLPLSSRPYHEIGERIGLDGDEVMRRMAAMLESGIIRRVGVVPNHYKLGVTANAMSVWDVDDGRISELGQKVGSLDFVSHCYHRPRHLPHWRYNLFAMVHGKTRDEVEVHVGEIAKMLGGAASAHDIIYSSEILKKTGFRPA